MKYAKTLALSAIVSGSVAAVPSFAASGFYGHVNTAIFSQTDKANASAREVSTIQVTPSWGTSGSRFGFKSSKTVGGTTVGSRIELSHTGNVRHASANIGGHWGRVTLGQTEQALSGTEETFHAATWLADGPGRGDWNGAPFAINTYRTNVLRYDTVKLANIVKLSLSVAPNSGNRNKDGDNTHRISFAVRADGEVWAANLGYVTRGEITEGSVVTGSTAASTIETILQFSGAIRFSQVVLDAAYNTVKRGSKIPGTPSNPKDQSSAYFKVEFEFGPERAGAVALSYALGQDINGVEKNEGTVIGFQARYDVAPLNMQNYLFILSDTLENKNVAGSKRETTTIGLGTRVRFGVDFSDDTLSIM